MTTGQGAGTLDLHEWTEPGDAVSSRALARGMLLLRASNMSVMRLQLAMERRDRRLALETLDSLVALDGEIRGLVQGLPAADGIVADMARRLDDQRSALASEKLVFAAGRSGPALAPGEPETHGRSLVKPAADREPDREPETNDLWAIEDTPPSRPSRRLGMVVAGLVLLLLGIAAASYWLRIDGLADLALGSIAA